MRRFFTLSLVLLALVISAAPVAHAEESCPPDKPTLDLQSGLCIGETGDGVAPTYTEDTLTQPIIDKAAGGTGTDKKPDPDAAYSWVMHKIATLFAWLVGIAAIVLNYAVFYTVVTMGDYVNNLSAIGVTWRILRDVGNIMLIFGFLIAGIMTILSTEQYGFGKNMLPKLLMAAILLNFSLFIAEAIVDTGNLFATQFYTQINGGTLPSSSDMSLMNFRSEGISNRIMYQLGFPSIYGEAGGNPEIFKGGGTWTIGFMAILLFIVAAFVMFSLAFILIARFVVLLFLLIISPVGFAGWAIPKTQGLSSWWWKELTSQTITAPVLLLLLYIALAVITDAKFLTGVCQPSVGSTNTTCAGGAWLGWVSGNFAGFASMLLSFLIAMGLLLAVIILSKKLSVAGGAFATQTAGKLTFGATAWAGRNTGGWLANKTAQGLRRTAFSRVPLVGTGLVKGLDKIGSANFDIRGTSALKKFPGDGIDAGTAQKGGYKAELKASVESRTKYAADLKGKDFKDLTPEVQLEIANQENTISRAKKEKTDAQKAGTLTPQRLKDLNKAIEDAEKELDNLHRKFGTERGNKLDYASKLANLPLGFKYLTANKDAAKKIKEEARKSKDDKDLDALKKALKKMGGGEEEGGGGTPPPGGPPPGGGAPGGPTPAA